MTENRKKISIFQRGICAMLLGSACGLWLILATVLPVEAAGIPDAPGIYGAPDGLAFTTDAHDTEIEVHEAGERLSTGIPSALRELTVGEHYYLKPRSGDIPIGSWSVVLPRGRCIHDDYPKDGTYHGISFSRNKCGAFYKTGWMATCADCGERLNILFYMNEATAEGIKSLPADLNYYYLCPFCDNLEQGRRISHDCKAISANRYYVTYRKNAPDATGYMDRSIFFYGNADLYEGQRVTGEVRLRSVGFRRIGYVFDGWNTAPDGSGRSFRDGEEVLNLTGEDEGMVVLYARWKPAASTLVIDAGEGLYDGRKKVEITMDYGREYVPLPGELTPPDGYLISFNSMGGEFVQGIRERQRAVGFVQGTPFAGRYAGGKFTFDGPDGSVSVLNAVYAHRGINLPKATRTGYSFGGWYADRDYNRYVGTAGDDYLPAGNETLYAKWVDLLLTSADNYRAYGGSGAVDLFWEQKDEQNKIYLLYRSPDGRNFDRIGSEGGTAAELLSKSFTQTGREETLMIPESGYYDIAAYGAQGGNFLTDKGGLGGSAFARIFLDKGENLDITVGSQDGYPSGGIGDPYGNGGGMSSVTSGEKGLLLVAGGGGGASPLGEGEPGGGMNYLRKDKSSAGESGLIGGGSGYIGGTAGEYLVHSHTDECFQYLSTAYEVFSDKRYSDPALFRGSLYGEELWGNELQENGRRVYAHTLDRDERAVMGYMPGLRNGSAFLSTDGNTTLQFDVELYAWGDRDNCFLLGPEDTYIKVYDQNHRPIFEKKALSIPGNCRFYAESQYDAAFRGYEACRASALCVLREEDDYGGWDWVKFTESVELPSGTTGVYLDVRMAFRGYAHMQMTFRQLAFTGGSYPVQICPYKEGQVLAGTPAGGGSNYCNLEYALHYDAHAGVNPGDGRVEVRAHSVGFQTGGSLKDVAARDTAPPDRIDESMLLKTPVEGDTILLSWQKPKDNGSTYFFKAESYSAESGEKLCESNTVANTLVSGVSGYLSVIDRKESTVVSAANGMKLKNPEYLVTLAPMVRYLHIAPVDVAGNVGPTVHIRLQAEDPKIPWEIYTRKLKVSGEQGNVYPAADGETFYVRADARTPFMLTAGAYTEHAVAKDNQIDRLILLNEAGPSGKIQTLYTDIQKCDPSYAAITLSVEEIRCFCEGEELLQAAAFTEAVREDAGKKVTLERNFTVPGTLSGERIRLTPVAAAGPEEARRYSEPYIDRGNGLTLIPDGEAPHITGSEHLEELLANAGGTALDGLTLRAADPLSGVRLFEVVLFESGTYLEKTFTAGADGRIGIALEEDSVFRTGSVTVTIRAIDNVGNEAVQVYESMSLSVEASIERILEPGGSVFKAGESGILTITVTGGAKRLEITFPEELTALDESLDRSYEFAEPISPREVRLQFMVPLRTPENENYHVRVRAFRDGRTAEAYPVLSVISSEDGVLGEIRTRLR